MADIFFLDRLTVEAKHDGVQRLVVGAVVEYEGRVLLLQRPANEFMGGIFELPSGRVELGEALDTALIREVKEETGLDATEIHDYIGSFDYLSSSGEKSRQFNFAVYIKTPKPIELQEHDSYHWAPLTEELPVTNSVKEVLDRYRELRGI